MAIYSPNSFQAMHANDAVNDHNRKVELERAADQRLIESLARSGDKDAIRALKKRLRARGVL